MAHKQSIKAVNLVLWNPKKYYESFLGHWCKWKQHWHGGVLWRPCENYWEKLNCRVGSNLFVFFIMNCPRDNRKWIFDMSQQTSAWIFSCSNLWALLTLSQIAVPCVIPSDVLSVIFVQPTADLNRQQHRYFWWSNIEPSICHTGREQNESANKRISYVRPY